jgi:valyl-tRNA synthetase
MKGKNACWVPGTDHASIATEAKVVAMLKERGINKKDITRPEFLEYAWEWKEKYGGIILEQLKKLGASCDWDRTRFTMDEELSEAVIDTFIHLYKKGLIYRGVRMVNWDPQGKTAVSDEEVIRKEVNQKLYYIKYNVVPDELSMMSEARATHHSHLSDRYLTIATTRPETIMADAAICINPNDERYLHLHGKKVFIPLINREIPVILDEYVTMDFGTGCLKVTPAHDLNDYELGQKHKLPVIDILNDDGTLNEKATILVGEDRFAARKKIAVF